MIQEFLEKEAFRARGVAQESPAKLDPSVPRGKKVIPALQDSWGVKASWWVENFHRKQRQPSQIIKKLYRATRSFELPPQFSYTAGGKWCSYSFLHETSNKAVQRELAVLILLSASHSWSSRRNRRSEREWDGNRKKDRYVGVPGALQSSENTSICHRHFTLTVYSHNRYITLTVMKNCSECKDSRSRDTIVWLPNWYGTKKHQQSSWERLTRRVLCAVHTCSMHVYYFFILPYIWRQIEPVWQAALSV